MAQAGFTVGPVLSFRGVRGGSWRVTSLIVVPESSATPSFHVDGKACPPPEVLLTHGKQTTLRYDLSCSMSATERRVEYGVTGNPELKWSFTVPGRGFAPRMAYASCNGFSDPKGMRKLVRPENEVWADFLYNHDRETRPSNYALDKEQLWHEARIHDKSLQRFHLLLLGGDQIYFDSIWEDIKPLEKWVRLSRKEQLKFKVSETLSKEIESYYFQLYSKRWKVDPKSAVSSAHAMSRVPTVMMWDDHDIFDGWGSYSEQMQDCELFKVMFGHARKAFWIYQMQHRLQDLPPLEVVEGTKATAQYKPIPWATHLSHDALGLPLLDAQPGFSSAYSCGTVSIVAADLRTERSRAQVLGSDSWSALQGWLAELPDGEGAQAGIRCQHLIFMSSVPVVHPKLSLAEGLLDTFGQDHVQDSNADDLKDHWSHDDHEGERKRLLETLSRTAESKLLRVSIVSGDVHVAAWGMAYRNDTAVTANWHQIQQFTSSAIIHPSLVGVAERLFLHLLNRTAKTPQRLDGQNIAEMMLFPSHNRYVMAARNWLALELDMGNVNPAGCRLWATWRCETESGFSNHLQAVEPAKR